MPLAEAKEHCNKHQGWRGFTFEAPKSLGPEPEERVRCVFFSAMWNNAWALPLSTGHGHSDKGPVVPTACHTYIKQPRVGAPWAVTN